MREGGGGGREGEEMRGGESKGERVKERGKDKRDEI